MPSAAYFNRLLPTDQQQKDLVAQHQSDWQKNPYAVDPRALPNGGANLPAPSANPFRDMAQQAKAPSTMKNAMSAVQGAAQQTQQQNHPYGSASGPTYVEQRYFDRLNGEDPAFNYALKRGTESLGNQYSAAGMFNSGAAAQGQGDLIANIMAHSQGQLDQLAGAATGARQNQINGMFSQGLGLAGGESGLTSAYDLGAAGNMSAANQAQQQMALNKAGVDAQANQGLINTGLQAWGLYNGMGGKKGGGAETNPLASTNPYDASLYNANNPYKV